MLMHNDKLIFHTIESRAIMDLAIDSRTAPASMAGKQKDHDGAIVVLICVFAGAYYAILSTGFKFDFFHESSLTFNSMLRHLLHGEFFVDAEAVGAEGFLRDGHVYAYWGVFCALLRLPLAILGKWSTDITYLSCLVASCLIVFINFSTILFIKRRSLRSFETQIMFVLLIFYIVFGPQQIAFLHPSIYQEVISWSFVFASAFVYGAVRGVVQARFSQSLLVFMAAMSGLALSTRVSTGVGLFLAMTLFISVACGNRGLQNSGILAKIGGFLAELGNKSNVIIVLVTFLIAAGIINYYRWEDPLTFANYNLYLMNNDFPDRLLAKTGENALFDLSRIPFGLLYYFLPVWIVTNGNGRLLFQSYQERSFDAVEMPPSSFLLTDLPVIFLACFFVYAALRTRPLSSPMLAQVAAIAGGLAAPCLLMLTAISMNYRYRIEFYPLFNFLAFIGLYVAARDKLFQGAPKKVMVLFAAMAVLSIVSAHIVLALYRRTDFGPAQLHLHSGSVYSYYIRKFHGLK